MSVSRLLPNFEGFTFGFGQSGLRKKSGFRFQKNLVSEKASVSENLVSEKVSVSVSVNILVSSFTALDSTVRPWKLLIILVYKCSNEAKWAKWAKIRPKKGEARDAKSNELSEPVPAIFPQSMQSLGQNGVLQLTFRRFTLILGIVMPFMHFFTFSFANPQSSV